MIVLMSASISVDTGGQGRWFDTEAVSAQIATPNVDVLIGIDFLIKIDMAWSGTLRSVFLLY
jgi:hypothetical protein